MKDSSAYLLWDFGCVFLIIDVDLALVVELPYSAFFLHLLRVVRDRVQTIFDILEIFNNWCVKVPLLGVVQVQLFDELIWLVNFPSRSLLGIHTRLAPRLSQIRILDELMIYFAIYLLNWLSLDVEFLFVLSVIYVCSGQPFLILLDSAFECVSVWVWHLVNNIEDWSLILFIDWFSVRASRIKFDKASLI